MPIEHVDVLIVGAGLSGVGAACHLQDGCPDKSFTILEARDAIGGTWDLFRYPGIRSDSDMFTLGYDFRPWSGTRGIADGASIRQYIRQTATERGIDRRIRFGHRVVRAEWSSEQGRWTVVAERATPDGGTEEVRLTCSLLYINSGYYRYDEGYTPQFPGVARFGGTIVHPQHWPQDLDYAGKRVVVIGSGATAITLVPSMAPTAGHVTMLQRTPTYIVALPQEDPLARLLKRLPARLSYPAVRWKNILVSMASFQLSRHRPRLMRAFLRRRLVRRLPAGYPVDTHFNPPYNPWDQRLCVIPNGDFLREIRRGRVDVVTDTIETFTENGIRLASGAELAADVIVTATGLKLLPAGGIELSVDGEPVDLSKKVIYKGMMLSDVPNLVMTLGYTNASWTLKADLVADYVCRLLRHLDERGYRVFTPVAPPASQPLLPFLDLNSGYVTRDLDWLPKQGSQSPWRLYQNYPRDIRLLRHGPLEDAGIRFSGVKAPAAASRTLDLTADLTAGATSDAGSASTSS